MKLKDNIIVTGSEGFIGKHLMEKLGDRGFGYDWNLAPNMDVNYPKALHDYIKIVKPKAIVHLAAVSNLQEVDKSPEQALKTNIVGSFNVLRLAHEYGIRVILASSAAVVEPELSVYGTSKACMEEIAGMFPNAVIMRFFNVYGPGSKSVVNKFIKLAKANKPVSLNGNPTRDYIYVDDVVEAIVSLIDASKPNRIVEVGTRRAVSLNKLVSMISQAIEKPVAIILKKPIKEIQSSESFAVPVWYKTTLEQGIRRLI